MGSIVRTFGNKAILQQIGTNQIRQKDDLANVCCLALSSGQPGEAKRVRQSEQAAQAVHFKGDCIGLARQVALRFDVPEGGGFNGREIGGSYVLPL